MFKLKLGPVNALEPSDPQSFLCHVLGRNYVLETEETFPEKQPIPVLALSWGQMSVQVSQHWFAMLNKTKSIRAKTKKKKKKHLHTVKTS